MSNLKFLRFLIPAIALAILLNFFGCISSEDNNSPSDNDSTSDGSATGNVTPVIVDIDFKSTIAVNNRGAYVTSQCYTKTSDEQSGIHNPCYSCHINSVEPNYIDDYELQQSYDFGEYTKINRFTNLFKDRTDLLAKMSDKNILDYVRQDNYQKDGKILISEKLKNVPAKWDVNDDGKWGGYIPDMYFNFDEQGFDKTPDGEYTLWRAFAYYPFLGTFWPTNGSTDDVMIRLPNDFASNESGEFDLQIYKINLAIVESLIKKADVPIEQIDETFYQVDLNQNGSLDNADTVVYNWQLPSYLAGKYSNFSMHYVGLARLKLIDNDYLIAPGLYPKGTEFLHSVRYLDVGENDKVTMAPRMKELRYGKKYTWNTYAQLSSAAFGEIKAKDDFPDRLRKIVGNTEDGLKTGLGWVYQGFIEDKNGDLRPQNYEETTYCIGCHSGIGAIADSTFVFQRKFSDDDKGYGWYHWTQDTAGFSGIPEPKTKNGTYEYTTYLQQNRAGDEFRSNQEVRGKFFDSDLTLNQQQVDMLHNDISLLLIPSAKRAIELNKAYKIIVEEQSYIFGRDAHIGPAENVHKEVIPGTATGIFPSITSNN